MKQLPAETIRLISSSQVITSVFSVVKELVENSLDANATSIDVKLENYGFDKIEVRDNGDGIGAADVPVMAVKHYTSKISSTEDLENLTTYGFRGEALGSICSTAEVLITTKTTDDDFSTQYNLDRSGHIISQKPSHLGQGTTVTVLKLFKNLPVRKQFYSTERKCKEEIKKIQKLVMAYGIIKPDLRITFTNNKTVIWQKTRVPDHKTAFMAVVGAIAVASMSPFQHHCEDPEIIISGFLPKPNSDSCLTSHSDRRFVFVNNRPVYQKEILKLTQQYCNLKSDKESNKLYPIFFINITIPSSAVDVNLTPDKSQVLLHNKESICLALQEVLASLYGHLPEATSSGTKTANDVFFNETEQANISVNKNESHGNTDSAWTNLYSCSNLQNDEREKNTGTCLTAQTPCNNSSLSFPTLKERLADERNGCGNFQDALLSNCFCEDQQSKSKTLFDLDTNIFMNLHSKNGSEGDLRNTCFQEAEKIEEAAIAKDSSEITADEWSLGNAFKNSRGSSIEPVQILIPGTEQAKLPKKCDGDGQQKPQEENNNQNIKKLSVVNDKLGQITAYDLIRSQIIKKPMSAFDIFTQDCRPGLLAENTKASTEELMLKVEEMWMKLNEEERKNLFSDTRCIDVLWSMAKESVNSDGSSYLSDSRLVANGFKIKIIPGVSATDNQLEIEGIANCLPYYGVSDLKELLSAVINNNAKELHECRPLKVINYLEGEAVRLSRQLPLYLSKEDVQDTLRRMEKQLGNQHRSCVHGRPFFHYLTDIP
uniref:PMS1 homolog 1, mismatch repair system component n=1 Tax=Salvator merianae TaxID=96440 RepID=A0A8D0E3T6_SALMN